ncbi:hypothetical protein JCM17846_15150 [Iodidimonas nitroreducens]|uniref:Protein TonB n=1 Tax=Iodidimonas nitroreducens TaxID=1236968 RepID=A0A5A7N683_9PROT|nr:energy transducer TonB [Iodidimonas nitroreducens]GAK34596.1 protein TonB [alpha proteobacterium Q-1]GER03833.1 hypothetical protein JCM17846_15150 [Iodidimonas nitroreducens]
MRNLFYRVIPVFIMVFGLAACAHFQNRDAIQIHKVAPVYPEQARASGIEGRVVLEYIINEEGIPVDIQIVEAEPQGVFEPAAIAAVSQWRYQPALKLGRPTRSPEAEAVLNFELDQPGS